MRRNAVPVYLLYFLSGAAALVCEVSWSRQVGLIVGNTAGGAALVLVVFFTGMAFGQLAGGRVASRVHPLLGYGLAELAAAAWVCLVPTLLAAVGSADTGDAATAAACFAVLLPATAAFGATLPFVAEHLSGPAGGGRRVALAYGLNTAGGVAGVVAASAFLLVEVGVVASSYLAAGVSAGCGLAACAIARASRSDDLPGRTATTGGEPVAWGAVAAVSGFSLLGLEVLYTRLFALVLHNSTYTFGAVVAVFLAGLALGAALVAALGRLVPPRLLVAAGCALGSVSLAVSVVVFACLTGLGYFSAGNSFADYLGGVFTLVAEVVFAPSVLLGMTLPAVFAANGGRAVGRLTAVNTAGAVAGTLVVGFLLVPWFGLWGTFALVVALCGLTGVVVLLWDGWRKSAAGTALVLVVAVIVAGSGPQQASQPPGKEEELVRRWETAYGWIDVTRSRNDGALRVRQNLHYRHGSTASAVREYRQGRLPLLLHPLPAETAFLGLGTGLTAAPAVTDQYVGNVVVVELIPEVVEAARVLADANRGVVDHPKVEVRVEDARHYLGRADRRFDVIVADMFVPWESRAGYLYTVEFYETARRRLKPGGLFCQWLALYQFGPDEFELVADSFAAVFPEVTLWWGQLDGRFPIVALVGSEGLIELDPERLETRLRALAELPGGADPELARPANLLGLYLGRWPARELPRLNTDEHPRLEFAAPVTRGSGRTLSGATLRAYFDDVLVRLPEGGIRPGPRGDDSLSRRAAQRLGLFGPAPP